MCMDGGVRSGRIRVMRSHEKRRRRASTRRTKDSLTKDLDCRDEPGHDENKERASVLEQRALAAEARLRESDQRALKAEAQMRESEQRAAASEAGLIELAAMFTRVKNEWPDIFDASGAVRAPAASERDRLAQLVAAQERARNFEERAIAAEGALREAQLRARDMEQRACAAEELIAGRR